MGEEVVLKLGKHRPDHLYFTGRNTKAADVVIDQLRTIVPGLPVTFIQMNMASLSSVKSSVAMFVHDRLDILICNAGIMDVPPAMSTDGFEIHMAVNHIAHAMLIRELLPVMQRTASEPDQDVRIIILSSAGFINHPKEGLAWDKVRTSQGAFIESLTRYG
jgi:NAD(P)-dependent dehydrogenase (short-subunit alcohol dehydrogenase family)